MKFNVEEFIDKKFNHLTVIEDLGIGEDGWTHVKCLCDCGNTKDVILSKLKSGIIKSCGCLRKSPTDKVNKLRIRERLYGVWHTMKSRCYNTNVLEYSRYGALGVRVCDEWKNSYKNFKEWAESHGYDKNAKRGECTLDRINHTGNYEPSNCRWVNMKVQSNNTKRNHYLEFEGVTHTVKEWSEIKGIDYHTLLSRVQKGDTGNRLFRPLDKVKIHHPKQNLKLSDNSFCCINERSL